MKWNKNLFISSGTMAALGSTICCWGPAMLAGVAGLTGTAYIFSWLHPLKPYLAGIAVVSLTSAFYQVYHKKNTEKAGCQYYRITKTVLWTVAVFAALSFTYPYHNGTLFVNTSNYSLKNETTIMQASDTTKQKKEIQLKVTRMSCNGCSNRCQRSLLDLNGIMKADVSYQKGAATIEYNPDTISEAQIIQQISEIGFKAKKINEHE
ncbi:MAG: hypothetical protein BRD50_08800 [Bacteroidetes bacterium SW_11_45_7]|nr:MAG: hypothetical protein BRD50_08800 [Bacteroidetes bacterium SW_11_45_7]